MKKTRKPLRCWYLWVHKEMETYFDFGTHPRIGGNPTTDDDFEEVIVKEVRRKIKPRPVSKKMKSIE